MARRILLSMWLLSCAACSGAQSGDDADDDGAGAGAGASASGSGGVANAGGSGGASGKPGAMSAGSSGGGGAVSGSGGAQSGSTGGAPSMSSGGDSGTPIDGGGDDGTGANGFYRLERLDRGVVAVQTAGGVYVGWRMFGYEYTASGPDSIAYDVYRDGTRVATVKDSTNYLDAGGSADSSYTVRPVLGGRDGEDSENASVWKQNYLRIPLKVPAGGKTPGSPQCETANEAYTYSANDASVGDVDGDGAYEVVLKWDPSNSKDNSQSGCTGNVYIDAYRLDGTQLWRIDMGRNIRAGAHYSQFIVYDFDGDGKAEMAVKTAPGTRDGTGAYLHLGAAANDDDEADYRSMANASDRTGYVLSGPEYLSVFSGETGAELATEEFIPQRGSVNAWGDNYGNRVDRFLAGAAHLDDTGLASIVMSRGYYTRTTLTAWNWRDGKLAPLWKFDSNDTPKDSRGNPFTGQGAHSLSIANIDADPNQEIIYGAMTVDHDGSGKCSTGYGHGDATHVGDFVLSRPGLEMFMPHEDKVHPAYDLHDPSTCEVLVDGPVTGKDTGRGAIDDISAGNPGAEMWAADGTPLLAADGNKNVGASPESINFLIWWDADETRELENATSITKYGGDTLLDCDACASNNGTKSTPALVADLYGDWREEVLWREADSSALRLYTTTDVTTRRIYTLMHDPQYRAAIAWQNVGYNQPPHPSFHIGNGMADPPRPDIRVR